MSKSMEQLLDTKADLESYFTSDVLKANPWMSSEWVFVPIVYCEKIEEGVEISQTCQDFVIKGKYFLLTYHSAKFIAEVEHQASGQFYEAVLRSQGDFK